MLNSRLCVYGVVWLLLVTIFYGGVVGSCSKVDRKIAHDDTGGGVPYADHPQVEQKNITMDEILTYLESIPKGSPSQLDASTVYGAYYQYMYAPEGSTMKAEALQELYDEMSNRRREDNIWYSIVNHLFGSKVSLAELQTHTKIPEEARIPSTEDFYIDSSFLEAYNACEKSLMNRYEENCGRLSLYGRKYWMSVSNMCKRYKITGEQMALASSQVCGK